MSLLRFLAVSSMVIFLYTFGCHSANAASAHFCVTDYFQHPTAAPPDESMKPGDVELLLREIRESVGVSVFIQKVIPCKIDSHAALYVSKGEDEVPPGNYITYDPVWMRNVVGNNTVEAIAIFGHELGHVLNGDSNTRSSLPSAVQEQDADRFAGCAVARMMGDWGTLSELIDRIRADRDSFYPDRLTSKQAAHDGFDRCAASRPIPEQFNGISIQYEQWMRDGSFYSEAFSELGLRPKVIRKQGRDWVNNAITCSRSVKFSAVRALALYLYDKGMFVNEIYQDPSIEEDTDDQIITIRGIAWGNEPPLSRADIAGMNACTPRDERVYGIPTTIVNACARGRMTVYAIAARNDDGSVMNGVNAFGLDYGGTYTLNVAPSETLYFAEINSAGISWGGDGSHGSFSLPDGRSVAGRQFDRSVVPLLCTPDPGFRTTQQSSGNP